MFDALETTNKVTEQVFFTDILWIKVEILGLKVSKRSKELSVTEFSKIMDRQQHTEGVFDCIVISH